MTHSLMYQYVFYSFSWQGLSKIKRFVETLGDAMVGEGSAFRQQTRDLTKEEFKIYCCKAEAVSHFILLSNKVFDFRPVLSVAKNAKLFEIQGAIPKVYVAFWSSTQGKLIAFLCQKQQHTLWIWVATYVAMWHVHMVNQALPKRVFVSGGHDVIGTLLQNDIKILNLNMFSGLKNGPK